LLDGNLLAVIEMIIAEFPFRKDNPALPLEGRRREKRGMEGETPFFGACAIVCPKQPGTKTGRPLLLAG
jgi:hypothetical protein